MNTQSPYKSKLVRANNSPYMNKELRKAIMVRSRLKNLHFKEKSNESKARYNRQMNYCLSLLRRTKRNYFANLKDSNIIDNKKFWKTVQPLFSNKGTSNNNYTLMEGEEIINEDKKIAQIFNDYYSQTIANLDLPVPPFVASEEAQDHTVKCMQKYKEHPSVLEIQKIEYPSNFSFENTTRQEVEKIIKNLTPGKSQPTSDIPVKICLLYTSPSPRDRTRSRMPSSA